MVGGLAGDAGRETGHACSPVAMGRDRGRGRGVAPGSVRAGRFQAAQDLGQGADAGFDLLDWDR